jgi:hypothetical protein
MLPEVMQRIDDTLAGVRAQVSTKLTKAAFIETAVNYYCQEMETRYNNSRPFSRTLHVADDPLAPLHLIEEPVPQDDDAA